MVNCTSGVFHKFKANEGLSNRLQKGNPGRQDEQAFAGRSGSQNETNISHAFKHARNDNKPRDLAKT